MTPRLRLLRATPPAPLPTPERYALETAAVILEARAARGTRVTISDAMAREIAGALRHLAALKGRTS